MTDYSFQLSLGRLLGSTSDESLRLLRLSEERLLRLFVSVRDRLSIRLLGVDGDGISEFLADGALTARQSMPHPLHAFVSRASKSVSHGHVG